MAKQQACGHPLTWVVRSDEETYYCRACEDAARQMDAVQPVAAPLEPIAQGIVNAVKGVKRWKPTLHLDPEYLERERDREDAEKFRFLDWWNRQGRLFAVYRGELRAWVTGMMTEYPEWEDGRR